jgi:UDP-2,4-diacetamido-2,4,6-trideoxy-beta-L-altropyranose hydrolase
MARIAIRADGGSDIGIGHIMRCLSLAKAFTQKGHIVYFLSKYSMGIALMEKEGFQVIQLPCEKEKNDTSFCWISEKLLRETEIIIEFVKQYKIDILVIDSYNVTEQYFLALRPHVRRLVYIDDDNKFAVPSDIVVNGNITAEYLEYKKYEEGQLLLLGPQYNMIRGEFQNISKRIIRENVQEIMITTGGTDPYNLTVKLINIFLRTDYFKDIRFNVLVGGGFLNQQELIKISNKFQQIKLYSTDITNQTTGIAYSTVRELMLQSDLAISAGGSTLYEFAACGTPVLAFIMAENQQRLVDMLAQLRFIINLGWYDKMDEATIIHNTKLLADNYDMRFRMANKSQNLVDTLGAERIVQKVTADLSIV